MARRSGDPSLAPNVGPASMSSSVGGLPPSSIGSGIVHPSLAERRPLMYTIPPREMLYEQPESALVREKEMFLGSDVSVSSIASE